MNPCRLQAARVSCIACDADIPQRSAQRNAFRISPFSLDKAYEADYISAESMLAEENVENLIITSKKLEGEQKSYHPLLPHALVIYLLLPS